MLRPCEKIVQRPMKILVTFAVEAEFAPWRKRHPFQVCAVAPGRSLSEKSLYEAVFSNCSVRVFLTGIGVQNAASAMKAVIQTEADVCISSGLAGALAPAYRVGDIVAARRVSSLGTNSYVSSDGNLLARAADCGAKVANTFITSEKLVVTGDNKRAMSHFGDVVEMESYAVLQAARGLGVPAVAVRAISDAAGEDLPLDFTGVLDDRGRIQMLRMMSGLARRPRRIPGVVRFGLQCHRAAERLADFLDRYISVFSSRKNAIRDGRLEEASAT
jgi:nucleoside phosphorylase